MFLPSRKDAIHKAWMYRILRGMADDEFLVSVMYFKGGTCAAMRNLLDRFSVDLDFDFVGQKDLIVEARKHLEIIFARLGLKIDDASKKVPQYFLKYPIGNKHQRNTLKIDTFFPPLKGNKYEPVRLVEINRILYCQTIETMFANKMIALVDRFEKSQSIAGRDLYDIHYFFLQGYSYDAKIIENYSGQKIGSFLQNLIKFIEKNITQRIIDQDINFLLPPQRFRQIRKNLKSETISFLNDELERVKKLYRNQTK